jgi:putative ABC transport system permease protein
MGIVFGLLILYGFLILAQPHIEALYGLTIGISLPSHREWLMLGLVGTSALIIGLIPGYRAYRQSLADGMSIRL